MPEDNPDKQLYIDQLYSDDTNTVIKAAHTLGDLGDRQAVPMLIDMLQTTSNPTIRDAIAVGLRELGDERALHPLLSLIADPKTEGHRGTLVYALEGFNCASCLSFLVDLVISSNFEVSHQAFLVIESIESKVSAMTLDTCLQRVQEALSQSDDEKVELLKELIEMLNDMKCDCSSL